jgi:hypothetical protein
VPAMKIGNQRFRRPPGTRGEIYRRRHGRLFELRRAVEEVEDGLSAGYLPHSWASLLIARLEKRDLFRVGAMASDVR